MFAAAAPLSVAAFTPRRSTPSRVYASPAAALAPSACLLSRPAALAGAAVVHQRRSRAAAGAPLKATRPAPVRSARQGMAVVAASDIHVMINDISGKMGRSVAEEAVKAGLKIVPYSFTGPKREPEVISGVEVTFFDGECDRDAVMEKVKAEYPDVIIVDYTVPFCVNANGELYTKHMVPFVMGTTGGDRDKLLSEVEAAGLYAVIAPQMGKQVVAFQAAMKIMADTFPGAFTGYTLKVVESHQSSKVDTSGTAKAIVASFQDLGLDFDVEDIEMVRTEEEQTGRMNVPKDHLLGHAYHTYELQSPDGMVNFRFDHNVCGRSIYAQGTVDAVLCLAKQIKDGNPKKLWNMIDVLKEGNMR